MVAPTARLRAAPGTPQSLSPAPLAVFRLELERALARELTGVGVLEDAARPLVLSAQSKRARPMVAHLVGRAVGARPERVLDVAVAVELVHAASLLHDDVVDGAAVRRGLPSANARVGASLAVLSGDLLLTAALARLRAHGPAAIDKAIAVVAEMTRAVAFELATRRRTDVALDEWRAMAEGKTGALFGCAAWLVAAGAGDLVRAERLDRALRHLGVAFQIADDVDDLALDSRAAGPSETPLLDLRDGNPSLPVLLAAHASDATRTTLATAWSDGTVPDPSTLAALAERVLRSGALERSRAMLDEEIGAARALLAPELDAGVPELVAIFAWAESLASATHPRYLRAPADPARHGG